jgi:superfamily II DNA or RNA helicase
MNLFSPPPRSLPLRQYQYENVVEILGRIWRGERRIVDKLPTRAGKTRIAIEIAKRFLIEGKRVVFVTPRKSLIEQTRRAFEREGFDHIGIIQAGVSGIFQRPFKSHRRKRLPGARFQTLTLSSSTSVTSSSG